MGLWNKIKKSAKSSSGIAGLLTGGGGGLVTGGSLDMFSKGKTSKMINSAIPGMDDILGKKAKDINPDDIANSIRATQMKGIGELNSALDGTSSADIVTQGAEQAKKGILTSAQDARRNAQQSMAQQGLKGTSLGLGLNRSINQSTGDSIANVNAQIPGQIRNQSIQDAQTRIGVGGVNQNGMNFNTIQGQREGGLLGFASAIAPLAGQAAGAYKDYQTGSLASRRS